MLTAACAVLSGCTAPDDVSVRLVGGHAEFAVCESFDFNRVRVMTDRSGAVPSHLHDVWVAESAMPFKVREGDILPYGVAPSGGKNSMEPERLPLDGQIVQFYAEFVLDGEVQSQVAAQFDGSDISESHWLNSIRGTADSACG